ncbi:HIT family protein [Pseudomonas putida]|uniref:HIT family protein n=1 Tax=Pseudomonas putida TaxID=303 RepID=A0AA37RMU9_PSEPU|nr:HIT family protein [Pseudomonas putida]GLO15652.1 HIT family protein [Pseudomonas putida]GLO37184.1 HIT family protein [Pseudomonas putida]HDS0964980.1 HIT family protein [Pseudomonas putida]HDS0991362.1 HIT family protein [Pseudomonas putida]
MQAKLDIPSRFIIHETRHWVLNHRMNSALPGYLMLSARAPVNSLAALRVEAQAELGILMARTQQVMEAQLQPARLYMGRYGHEAGYAIHFHFIPVYPWVEALFWADERYRALQAFGWTDSVHPQTDGAELTLYVWREFCERPEPPAIQGYSVDETITLLRRAFSNHCASN